MPKPTFQDYFTTESLLGIRQNITLALQEDGRDLTAEGVFAKEHTSLAHILAKEKTIVVGLPLISLICEEYYTQEGRMCTWEPCVQEGDIVLANTRVANISGSSADILKLERIFLNYICHLSGIANLTAFYVEKLKDTGVRLLDTRKTLPGLRWLEKYAVRMGGGYNHRRDLTEMLMLKDTHIDACGSITQAVQKLRATYAVCPPIEVECRTQAEVLEAITTNVERIMLDNMPIMGNAPNDLHTCLPLIPQHIEVELSGGMNYDTIREYACAGGQRRADFISVGRLTHSAPTADFSLRISI